jgi:nicotinate-nucleotide adenylyltransferase
VSEKSDLWVPVTLVLAGAGLLAWNVADGSALPGVFALVAAILGALAFMPIRLRAGQRRAVAFGFGVFLCLVPAAPAVPSAPQGWAPWLVVGLGFLVPLRGATPRLRAVLLGAAALLAVLAVVAVVGILPTALTWLLLAGAAHLALQVFHSRPVLEPEIPPGPQICLYGGTFDPFHRGHRVLLEAALKVNDRVLVVVAGVAPHKQGEAGERTPFHHRVAMARLGIEGLGRVEVVELEGRRPPPHYTVDTLELIRPLYPPGTRFRLLLGADMFQDFPNWHRWEDILEVATLLVAARPGYDVDPPPEFEGRNLPVDRLECSAVDVSSTRLREDLSRGREVGDRISPAVRAYVEDHSLYGVKKPV